MKKKKNKDVEIDWEIRAVCALDVDHKTSPDVGTLFRTIGLSKYGLEIVGFGRAGNANEYAGLINTFGRMYAEGEVFEQEKLHTIGPGDGEPYDYKFAVRYFKDEKTKIRIAFLMPDFDWNIDDGEESLKDDIEAGCFWEIFNQFPAETTFENDNITQIGDYLGQKDN